MGLGRICFIVLVSLLLQPSVFALEVNFTGDAERPDGIGGASPDPVPFLIDLEATVFEEKIELLFSSVDVRCEEAFESLDFARYEFSGGPAVDLGFFESFATISEKLIDDEMLYTCKVIQTNLEGASFNPNSIELFYDEEFSILGNVYTNGAIITGNAGDGALVSDAPASASATSGCAASRATSSPMQGLLLLLTIFIATLGSVRGSFKTSK